MAEKTNVKWIGNYAFSHCKELTAFQVDAENASYSQDGGVLFTKDRDTLVSYPGGGGMEPTRSLAA